MADHPRDPDTGDETGTEHPPGGASGMTRWQKAIAIIGLVVLLVVVVLLFAGGGHGPGRHAPQGSQQRR